MEVTLFKLHARQVMKTLKKLTLKYQILHKLYWVIQASCSPSDENVEEINTDLFETTADEPVVDLDGWRVCVDTHTTGFVVKACEWDATLSSCKAGEEVLTLNTKGARNF